jgi:hypothetical protein
MAPDLNCLLAGWARSAQGAGEDANECAPRRMSERPEAATPRWPVQAATV